MSSSGDFDLGGKADAIRDGGSYFAIGKAEGGLGGEGGQQAEKQQGEDGKATRRVRRRQGHEGKGGNGQEGSGPSTSAGRICGCKKGKATRRAEVELRARDA